LLLLALSLLACTGPESEGDSGDPVPGDSCASVTWYLDGDADGHGDPTTAMETCDAPQGWVLRGDDCDDGDSDVHPGADEHCDGQDEDCDGVVDEPDVVDGQAYHRDADGDGYVAQGGAITACEQPSGYVVNPWAGHDAFWDCDDSDPLVHPGATETCNGGDDDCDGVIDDDATDASRWWLDGDGDGYGDPRQETTACEDPDGHTLAGDVDCDDDDPAITPVLDSEGHGCLVASLALVATSAVSGGYHGVVPAYVRYDGSVSGWASLWLEGLYGAPTYELGFAGSLAADGSVELESLSSTMYGHEVQGGLEPRAEPDYLLWVNFVHDYSAGSSGSYDSWWAMGQITLHR
jgi:hypothetical protein